MNPYLAESKKAQKLGLILLMFHVYKDCSSVLLLTQD